MAGTLVVSSIAKLASPATSRAALATFGINGAGRQRAAWAALIVVEATLAIGVAAGSALAAYLAAGLMGLFAAALALALVSFTPPGVPVVAASTVSLLGLSPRMARRR